MAKLEKKSQQFLTLSNFLQLRTSIRVKYYSFNCFKEY
jgi:hypothetical protein